MTRHEGCDECRHLWDAYASATHEYLKVEGKLKIARLAHDFEKVELLTASAQRAAEHKAALRAAVLAHEQQVHGAADIPRRVIAILDGQERQGVELARILQAGGYETAAFSSPAQLLSFQRPRAIGCLVIVLPALDGRGWMLEAAPAAEAPDGRQDLLDAIRKVLDGPAADGGRPALDEAGLRRNLDEARREYLRAASEENALVAEIPSGLPAPDGIFRIEKAAGVRHSAFRRYQEAVAALRSFLGRR